MSRDRFMGRYARYVLCAGLLLVAVPGCLAYGQSMASALRKAARSHGNAPHDRNTPSDQNEAWQWMQESLKQAKISNLQMENNTVTGQTSDGHPFLIHLALVSSIEQPSNDHLIITIHWYEFPYTSSSPGTVVMYGSPWYNNGAFRNAEVFYDSLSYLAGFAQGIASSSSATMLENFKAKATAWQQMTVKPAMPTEAHEHEVLAEYNYKNKDLPKAITEYEAALSIFPYWPDGQSNLANLAAEVGTKPGYRMAVEHMQMYLDLAPNAPDAEAARNSIIIWKSKLGDLQ